MSTFTIVNMIFVLGLVWGGLIYMIRLAARYEKRKKEAGE
ncbi:MAG: MetS family NSS transporter small subunit [Ignavibacteriaceae bacterium]|nr:MetS family NSS transporter small subunit [Ignavibacteriaceae bacterium]